MKITVFTPTYNRAYRLKNLYSSLVEQSFSDFEWLIIDDGSTDNTEKLVASLLDEKKINIKYIKQRNGGKHRAINRGVSEAKGSLFFIVDSDDVLPYKALQIIWEKYKTIESNNEIAGIAGLKADLEGKCVGSGLQSNVVANAIEIRNKYGVTGDLAEVFRTEILKKYPFPDIQNEKFCPEALVWNRIAQSYSLLYFNEIVYHCEYLNDGLTAKITKIRMNSPVASMLTYSELEACDIPIIQKLKANINFWRFARYSNLAFSEKIKKVNAFSSVIGLPIGTVLSFKDQFTVK